MLADFEGTTIDLAVDWNGATACVSDGVDTTCYRSEEQMDRALRSDTTSAGTTASRSAALDPSTGVMAAASSSCSSSVRLYSNSYYSGSVLAFTARGIVINLGSYGFSNVTSSFKIGACSSTFWDGSYGSGAVYPGSTWAWSAASTMYSGWDNRVSSIYIS
ncbi:MAG: hypothetical protein R2705_10190 [Ilumatobacteraceae bacterium]